MGGSGLWARWWALLLVVVVAVAVLLFLYCEESAEESDAL